MTNQTTFQSSQELGLMQGFPPQADKRATHENQLFAPYNRWSFQNELKLNRTVEVWTSGKPASVFETSPMDLSGVTYRNMAGTEFTFEDMVEMSYTDGIMVLHKGKVIYERYLNGMQPHTLHAWASGSKSVTGTLASILASEGLFDPEKLVSFYLPELSTSGFGDASIQQVMDMTTAVDFPDHQSDPAAENWQYGVAAGWCKRPESYSGAENIYEILPLMKKCGEHGQRFVYLTPNTDVLAWLIKRLTGKTLADLMQERLWSKLGVNRDAYWIVDSSTAETAGSGLITTLPDMARFGQMLLQKGYFNEQQIVLPAVIADFENGADPEVFSRGPASSPGNRGYSYHNQWWVTHNASGAYMAMGYGGQILYIAPNAEMVIAKFSSYPTPTPAGNEFYSAFAAFPALAKKLMETA
ncbi:MAG: 6-aminohexanoate hydrolase [Anaerolinea sp.]|nr:6-aminohexanoate hydrolase [Anaerolinea sp.]